MNDFSINAGNFFDGYIDEPGNAKPTHLAPPTQNIRINQDGTVENRKGYDPMSWDLGHAGKPAMPFYVERFNITFFAVDTKVYYIDHNNADAKVDTGITFTSGTVSRFEEHHGNIHVTNVTDGGRLIVITRLNGAVTLGAATIVTDIDGGSRANAFDTKLSPSPMNLRIAGTNEAYTSISDGTFTLTGTSSKAYSDNTIAIVVYDISAVAPKCAKFVEWKECIHAIGISADEATVSTDIAPSTLAFTKFAIATEIENSVTWDSGTAGTEGVGRSGDLQNALATRDYLYLFKTDETYYISTADVNQTTGARPPQYLGPHGCLNPDSAADMGNGEIVFLTSGKRIIRIKISTQSGAAVVYPDESFDIPLRNTLKKMASDQTGAFVYYHKAERLLFVQVRIGSEMITLVYDNNIQKWIGFDTNKAFRGVFEKSGDLYATDLYDDTVYKIDETNYDDGQDIQWVIATGEFENEDGRRKCYWKNCELSGGIGPASVINWRAVIGGQHTKTKVNDSEGISFSDGGSIGKILIGSTLGGDTESKEMVEWERNRIIYPSLGSSCQIILFGTGGSARLDSYTIRAKALSQSITTMT